MPEAEDTSRSGPDRAGCGGCGGWGGCGWRGGRLLRWGLAAFVVLFVGTLSMTGCMERLFYLPTRGPTPPPAEFPATEAVSFTAADGTRLHGWFIPAQAARGAQGDRSAGDGSPAPTVIHFHGNAGNIESHIWFTEYLPAAGFNLFIFDYRGYGESEGAARRRADLIADGNAALDAMLARGDVDPRRIGMYAQSLGGAIGLNVMAERPEIKAAVIESAFASWREIAGNAVGGDRPGPIARGFAALLIKDHLRPEDAIARIDRPILIFHGTADTIIPVSHGRALAAAAPNARLVELEGGDHNSLRATHPEMEGMVVGFLRGELGGE